MMRRTIFFGLIFLISFYTATAQEKPKHWIFLADKPEVLAKHEQVEENHLTDRAMARRTLRGELGLAARFAVQDAPVSQDYAADLKRRGIKIEQRSRWLNAVTARLDEDEIKRIVALPYVRSIRPVALLSTDTQPVAPVSSLIPERVSSNCPSSIFGNSCTQLDVVNAIPAIERGINGNGVVLGFIDTYFNTTGTEPFSHPSLIHIRDENKLKKFRDFTQNDPIQACARVSAHGMLVASVAAGYQKGQIVGPGHGATIYAAASECSSYERNIEEDNFVAAVEWLESEGVDVITASLGYYDFDDGQESYTKEDLDGDTGPATIAMDWAAQRGIVTVSSAGNGGPDAQTITTPADGDSVISVGGVWSSRAVARFSSRGPTFDGRIKPDVSGQAARVWMASVAGGYGLGNGTSLSAPMIAGIVTQILEVNPNLGPRDVWQILTATASQSSAPDNEFGWGIVDADAAIRMASARFLYQALNTLYISTGGDQWKNRSGWDTGTTPPNVEHFAQWHGLAVKDGDLTRIELSRNNLRGNLPPELGNLSRLRKLSLGRNQLTGGVPSAFGKLASLNILHLKGNWLTGLPPEIGNLSNLKKLHLGENQLTTLPPEIGNLSNLRNLRLQGNQLTRLPPEIGKLTNLKYLDLSSNQLSGEVPPELCHLSRLEVLYLGENNMTGTLPRCLMDLQNLATLSFGISGVCAPSDDEFQAWLSSIPNLGGPTCGSGVSFSDGIADQFYSSAHPITPLILPEAKGSRLPVTYAIMPELPAGLNFDPSTRTLSGTPAEVIPPTVYTYTATGADQFRDQLVFAIEILSSVSAEQNALPIRFAVHASYPNPFRDATSIRLDLPWPARVDVEVLDMTGRRVFVQPTANLPAGPGQDITLRGISLPSGAYLYRLTANSAEKRFVHTGHFVRVR